MIIAKPKPTATLMHDSPHEQDEVGYPKRGKLIKCAPLYRAHLKVRINNIINATLDELWVPLTLRCHLLEFISDLETELYEIEHRLTVVMWELHRITQELADYQEHHPDSALIPQIKMLDQEINSPTSPWMLYPQLCAS